MSELQYFQRYHGKENTHSSNALFLLRRLYLYSPKKFYFALCGLCDAEELSLAPAFLAQDTKNGAGSIPDFSISQESFKIIVEAKEHSFNIDQLDRHLQNLNKRSENHKILIALSPQNNVQTELDELKKSYPQIIIVHKSYMDFYDCISAFIDETRDQEFYDILEDYREYCEQERLIDRTDDTVMVRLTGVTYDFNLANGVYYDVSRHNPYGFRYLGLYKQKQVKAVGKIVKVVEAYVNEDGEIEYTKIIGKPLTQADKTKIRLAIEDRKSRYESETVPHWHFLVEKFVEVQNFTKKKGALYGKKKFSLTEDFGIKDIRKCSIEQIAEAMKDYDQWE